MIRFHEKGKEESARSQTPINPYTYNVRRKIKIYFFFDTFFDFRHCSKKMRTGFAKKCGNSTNKSPGRPFFYLPALRIRHPSCTVANSATAHTSAAKARKHASFPANGRRKSKPVCRCAKKYNFSQKNLCKNRIAHPQNRYDTGQTKKKMSLLHLLQSRKNKDLPDGKPLFCVPLIPRGMRRS